MLNADSRLPHPIYINIIYGGFVPFPFRMCFESVDFRADFGKNLPNDPPYFALGGAYAARNSTGVAPESDATDCTA